MPNNGRCRCSRCCPTCGAWHCRSAPLAGLVMLGGAPFHFWPADLFQGGRTWAYSLAAAALQIARSACSTNCWMASARCPGGRAADQRAAVGRGRRGAAGGAATPAAAAPARAARRHARESSRCARARHADRHTQRTATHALARALGGDLAPRSPARLGVALPPGGRRDRIGRAGGAVHALTPLTGIVGLIGFFSLAGWNARRVGMARSRALARRYPPLRAARAAGLAWVVAFSSAMRQWHEAAGACRGEPQPAAESNVAGAHRAVDRGPGRAGARVRVVAGPG